MNFPRLAAAAISAGAAACRIRVESADGIRVMEGVRKGELLRTALLRRGVSPHNGKSTAINCRGLGTCGTCAVDVSPDSACSPQTARERVRLRLPPHGPASAERRLACQCTVLGDMDVAKYDGFWGQDPNTLAPASEGTTYLGEFEFVLDTASPPPEPCGVCSGTQVVAQSS
jgi:ferredoxin